MQAVARRLITLAGLVAAWEALCRIFALPPYILPPPSRVGATLWSEAPSLAADAGVTAVEMLAGLALGTALGCITAFALAYSPFARRWLSPLVIASQALPVFAIAPLLVLWFGFGLASKIVMTTLIVYFPVSLAFAQGMERADQNLIDLARLARATRWQEIALIRAPSALPALAAGLRGATAAAPVAAIIGEWVGAAGGLGFVMVQANARMQTDVMFAALAILMAMGGALYVLVDRALDLATPWAEKSHAR